MPWLRRPLVRAFGMVAGYVFTFWLVRLVYLTLVTYSFVRQPEGAALQKIGDVVRANQVLTYGFSGLVFIAALHLLQPLTRTGLRQVFDLRALRDYFAPNALNGLILTIVLIAGSTIGGHMSYLGVYMKFDEVALTIGSALLFGVFLALMVVVEEYLVRAVLEPRLVERLGVMGGAAASAAIYWLIKYLQFDLGWLDSANLFLLSLTLSMIARAESSFMASASFAGTFLILLHVLFGLPFMGQDMPGLFLLRASSDEGLGSLLSGGASGPESGLVLMVLLVIYLYLPQIRSKKIEV